MPRSAERISRHLSLWADGRSVDNRRFGASLVTGEWQSRVGRPQSGNVLICQSLAGMAGSSRPELRHRQVSVLLRHGSSAKKPNGSQAPIAKPESLAVERLGTAKQSSPNNETEPVDTCPTLDGDGQRISIVEADDNDGVSIIVEEEPMIFTIFEAANIDGVQHLSSKSKCTRYTWFALILVFVCMCAYQIGNQAALFWWTPIATNIAAVYPASVPFPVVAICNNNQFRLTHLTDSAVQGRHAKPPPGHMALNAPQREEHNVFDRALVNGWDMGAVGFLRSASHKASDMVLRCQWPNGTRCSAARDFRPIWTLTGLCWAINSDAYQIHHVTGAGPGNALRLLLNVERYERIESCSGRSFRTTSLPGLKILIYNQSDVPVSSLDGVNVPPGYTMDIPFQVQHREKLPSGRDGDCLAQQEGNIGNSASKCIIANYMERIETRCNCSMRQAFAPLPSERLPFCNVWEYFRCVQPILQAGYEQGFSANLPEFPQHRRCRAPCQHIDYTAWQDIQELPGNILPAEFVHLDTPRESGEDWDDESVMVEEEGMKCDGNHLLNQLQVMRIRKIATAAYEKQARYQAYPAPNKACPAPNKACPAPNKACPAPNKACPAPNKACPAPNKACPAPNKACPAPNKAYPTLNKACPAPNKACPAPNKAYPTLNKAYPVQDDIVLRTRRLIKRVLRSSNRLHQLHWGPDNEYFTPVNSKLASSVHCYAAMGTTHSTLFSAIKDLSRLGDEAKANRLHQLLDERDYAENSSKYGTIAELRAVYGPDAESTLAEMDLVSDLIHILHSIFSPDSFIQRLSAQLHERLRRIHSLIVSYEAGRLTRQEWTERMQSRNMHHFLGEDFYEAWYNPLVRDLDEVILKVVEVIREEKLPQLRNISDLPRLAAVLLFSNASSSHISLFSTFLQSALDCALYAVKSRADSLLVEFQTAAHEFHSACVDLFQRELGDYSAKFEFGRRFAHENFVQVSVFLHRMHVEVWRQEPTYSIWSLFCDVGGALGLFLGASLLTLIEVSYFIWQTKIYARLRCGDGREEIEAGSQRDGKR